ncbi:MAG: AbiV family abortive infection protein [Pirellulales bacterium]|nr:AbiV family abortive infection protein [Pirellulales bacterium]
MTSKRLNQFRGTLSAAEIAAGINSARRNAQRLAEDARLLLNNKRYPSACALAVLAIEEAGKASVLRGIALAQDDAALKDAWRRYRRHTSKNQMWPIVHFVLKGARKLHDFAPLFHNDAEHPRLLDQLKQLSFYTDCLGKSHWSIPEEVIDSHLALMLVITGELLGKGKDISEREIELWIIHLSPVWGRANKIAEKEEALCDWYAALQAEGLEPPGENHMHRFILEGLTANDEQPDAPGS